MKLCVISRVFPNPRRPEYGAFVANLVNAFSILGHGVTTIAPTKWQDFGLFGKKSFSQFDQRESRGEVIRPGYLGLSNIECGRFQSEHLSLLWMVAASERYLNIVSGTDCFYGKFLIGGGTVARRFGLITGRPAFLDLGESNFEGDLRRVGANRHEYLSGFSGVVCVSESIAAQVERLGIDEDKILIAPNAVDKSRFRPLDRKECRTALNIPQEMFVVVFVGHFISRKGVLDVSKAVEGLPNVIAMFVGEGPQNPSGPNVFFRGRVPNGELPIYLNAADVFVLPTHAEGRSNAIEEALSCGLPIISTSIPSVREQVGDDAALLIRPGDVSALRQSIKVLRSDPTLRAGMATAALRASEDRDLMQRAQTIAEWVGKRAVGGR